MTPARRRDACNGDRCWNERDPSRSPSIAAGILSRLSSFDRDLASEQICDFVIGEPGLAQDLARVLSQSRRRAAQCAVRAAEQYRRPYYSEAAFGWMLGWWKHLHAGEMLVFRQSGEPVDRSTRDIGRFELFEPECSEPVAHAFGDQCIELGDMADAGRRVDKARTIGERRPAAD